MFDDETLRQFLAETLPSTEMARVEKALRDSAELRERLERARHERPDSAIHSLGAIWRRSRLTCQTREQLGSFLLDVLDTELSEYIKFHLEVICCPYCTANLADLQAKSQPTSSFSDDRRRRIFHSSRGLLSGSE
jgi:hypothetical protein